MSLNRNMEKMISDFLATKMVSFKVKDNNGVVKEFTCKSNETVHEMCSKIIDDFSLNGKVKTIYPIFLGRTLSKNGLVKDQVPEGSMVIFSCQKFGKQQNVEKDKPSTKGIDILDMINSDPDRYKRIIHEIACHPALVDELYDETDIMEHIVCALAQPMFSIMLNPDDTVEFNAHDVLSADLSFFNVWDEKVVDSIVEMGFEYDLVKTIYLNSHRNQEMTLTNILGS